MAIQEVEKKAAVGTAGIERSINQAAVGMVMDIVQAQQYQKPIPSTVRELTANAVDSQSEKEKAIKILKGEAKPEDYFIQREGALYEDSKWNPEYYNLEYLDQENNEVHLIYKEGEGTGRCDKFIVRDHGVGIGARRLKGVLEVGFSTKRNRKDALGAFGLGAKVGLATGADYYKMTTVYNGIKYSVQIFNKKVNSLVGSLNLTTGEQNIPYEFKNEEGEITGVIYGEKTDEKNYTEIEVPCLKHYRYDFETAVKTQLLFFNNVRFWRQFGETDAERYEINFKAEVLHNSDNLIIAKNTPYNKPFVVIVNGDNAVGVCYGHIDFKELELEDMRGAIGIKCHIRQVYDDPKTGEEVLVTPGVDVIASREAIRWTPATREFLLNRFEAAQDEATDMVQEELKESDFLKWIIACKNIVNKGSNDTAIGRLSRIVDMKNVKPKFKNTNIKYSGPKLMFDGVATLQRVTKIMDHKLKKYKIESEEIDGWSSFNGENAYFRETGGNTSRIKDAYLSDEHGGAYIRVVLATDDAFMAYLDRKVETLKVKKSQDFKTAEDFDNFFTKYRNKRIDYRKQVIELFEKSEFYHDYEEIEVPEDYSAGFEKEEEKWQKENALVNLTPAERRELENRIVANTYVSKYFSYYGQYEETFKKSKVEPKIKEIQEFENTIYYGFQVDEDKLQFACNIAKPYLHTHYTGKMSNYNENYQFLSVSKSNKKHFNKHSHIDDFFGKQKLIKKDEQVIGLEIVMDNIVIKWNTARIMKERAGNLSFFRNFSQIDEEMTEIFNEVNIYIKKYYKEDMEFRQSSCYKSYYNDFTTFLDNLESLQQVVEKDPSDSEAIASKVKELNLPTGTIGGIAVETEMLEKLETVLSYANPVRELFNHVDILTLHGYHESNKPEISMELGMFLKEILDMKGVNHE